MNQSVMTHANLAAAQVKNSHRLWGETGSALFETMLLGLGLLFYILRTVLRAVHTAGSGSVQALKQKPLAVFQTFDLTHK
jgi:hypothetical protein